MGRPIKKVNLGTAAGAALGIIISAKDAGSAASGSIVKQVGSKRYLVNNGGTNFRAKLDAGNSSGVATVDNTVVISGFLVGTGGSGNPSTSGGTRKRAAKLTQRRFIDSAGVRYKWQLVSDSAQDYIELTAI